MILDKMMKKLILLFIKLAISAGLFIFIIHKVDINQLASIFLSLKTSYFLMAFILIIVEQILLSYLWFILIKVKEGNQSFTRIIYITFISGFLGFLLPASVGTEFAKVYQLRKGNYRLLDCISSVLVMRVVSLSSLIFVSVAGIWFALYSGLIIEQPLTYTVLIISIFYFLVFYFFFKIHFSHSFIMNMCLGSNFLYTKIKQIYDSLIIYRNHAKTICFASCLGILIQIIRIITVYAASLALDLHIPIKYFFMLVPLVLIITLLPISLAGLGIREGAYMYLFRLAGVSATNSFTLSLTISMLGILIILLGGLMYVINNLKMQNIKI